MKRIIIIGNSSAARECREVYLDSLALGGGNAGEQFAGFLSHKGYPGNLGPLEHLLLGSDEDCKIQPEDRFIIGISDPALRREVYESMKAKGATFYPLISPRAYVSADAVLGEANIIGMGCTITGGAVLGNANYLNGGCRIGHDVVMGDYNFWGPGATALGCVVVGSENRFGAYSVLLEKGKVGDGNLVAPGAVVYKGCGSGRRMAGNPACDVAGCAD